MQACKAALLCPLSGHGRISAWMLSPQCTIPQTCRLAVHLKTQPLQRARLSQPSQAHHPCQLSCRQSLLQGIQPRQKKPRAPSQSCLRPVQHQALSPPSPLPWPKRLLELQDWQRQIAHKQAQLSQALQHLPTSKQPSCPAAWPASWRTLPVRRGSPGRLPRTGSQTRAAKRRMRPSLPRPDAWLTPAARTGLHPQLRHT